MKLKDALNIVFERVIGANTVDSADMEGMGGVGLIVNAVHDEQTGRTTLDHTWNEIKNAMESGGAVYIRNYYDETAYSCQTVKSIVTTQGSYYVDAGADEPYAANSADSYPYTQGIM